MRGRISVPKIPNIEKLLEFLDENLHGKGIYTLDMFTQTWSSTALGFDKAENGEPIFGGCAMTEAYTTVIHERTIDVYFVFFDEKFAYCVTDATERFFEDLQNRRMLSCSEAKKAY